jgi:hypothetical protein
MDGFIFNNQELTINEELSWRDVGNDLVTLNTSSGEYFTFNPIGRIIWLSIAEGNAMEQLVENIALEYDVEKSKVRGNYSA